MPNDDPAAKKDRWQVSQDRVPSDIIRQSLLESSNLEETSNFETSFFVLSQCSKIWSTSERPDLISSGFRLDKVLSLFTSEDTIYYDEN